MIYFFLFLLLLILEILYFKIANHYNIIDKPNLRSSHTTITLRGGGILFPIAIVIASIVGKLPWTVSIAVLLVAVVSFVDDIKPLSQLPRFASHLAAVLLVFYETHFLSESIFLILLVFVLFIGWINAFNFMDGINGITVLYVLVALSSFALLPSNKELLPLLIIIGLSALVFSFFNVRKKAKTFAGDVGSISMALFLGYLMLQTLLDTQQLGFLLFFAIYGIDAIITILIRLKRKENIFEAHRSHLYQYLANECRYSHLAVSFGYALTQLVVNITLIYLDSIQVLSLTATLSILILLVVMYVIIRYFVWKFFYLNKLKID